MKYTIILSYDDKGKKKAYYALNKLLEQECKMKRTIIMPDGRTICLPANTFVGEHEYADIEEAMHQVRSRVVIFKMLSGISQHRIFIVACEKPLLELLEMWA